MSLLTYTTYSEVRAALGVSATELPDSVVSLTQWDTLVVIGLEDVNQGIPALYDTVSVVPILSRSFAEQRFYELTRLYACYNLAQTLLVSLPLFAVKSLTDGRAEFERQADIYAEVKDGVRAMHNVIRAKLSAAFVALSVGAIPYNSGSYSVVVSVGLGTDPVTGA